MSVKSKMTALADQVRALFGSTQAKSIDAMTTDLTAANAEIASQADLLGQALALLEGKAAGGGGSGGGGGNANLDMGTFSVAENTYGAISIPHNLGKVPDFFMIHKEENEVSDQGNYTYSSYSHVYVSRKVMTGSQVNKGYKFSVFPTSLSMMGNEYASVLEISSYYMSTDKELKTYLASDYKLKAGVVYYYVCGCLGGAE